MAFRTAFIRNGAMRPTNEAPKRPRDPSQLGKLLVDIASGEKKEAGPKVSAAAS